MCKNFGIKHSKNICENHEKKKECDNKLASFREALNILFWLRIHEHQASAAARVALSKIVKSFMLKKNEGGFSSGHPGKQLLQD